MAAIEKIEKMVPKTAKSRRLSIVALSGAVLAVVWAGGSWAGLEVPETFVSAVATLTAMVAAAFEVRGGSDGG